MPRLKQLANEDSPAMISLSLTVAPSVRIFLQRCPEQLVGNTEAVSRGNFFQGPNNLQNIQKKNRMV